VRKIKIKDVITVALLTALYLLFYMVSGVAVTFLGQIAHAISPGITALITGTIFYFMSRKVGRFGQFTIMQAICLLIFSIMGAGYLPWIITSLVGALLADAVASTSRKPAVWRVAVASGLFHVGQAFGSIIPSWFFLDSYRTEWISRGQTPEQMDEMIKYTSGFMGVVSTAVVFAMSCVGVVIGFLILRKHFEKIEAKENSEE